MRPAYEDLIADRCVEAAAQPREACVADMMNWPGRVALRPVCPRAEAQRRIAPGVPSSEPASGERCSTPRPAHAAGRRLSLVERRRESRARSVRPLRVGDGPSRFLGGKRWKKPETASIIAGRPGECNAWGGEIAPLSPHCLLRCDNDATGPGQRLAPPYAAGEDAAQPQPQQRPVPVHFGASQRLLASPDLLTPAFPVPGV